MSRRSFTALGYVIDLVDLKGVDEIDRLIEAHEQKYSEQVVREAGRADGGKGIPPLGHEGPTPFEQELMHAMKELALRVSRTYKAALEAIDAKIKAERQFVEARKQSAVETAESLHQAERSSADDEFGLKSAHKELERAEKHYESMYNRLGRKPVVYLPHWAYVALALMIFVGEIPLNAMVFQIFGENQVMTWVMAFVIGVSIPVAAHFIGIKFREHGEGISVANVMKGSVGLAIVVLALYMLSIIRQSYLGENMEALGLTARLVDDSFMFFYLNLAVLGAAIMVSYLAHDSVPGYERALVDPRRAQKAVEKKERVRLQQLKRSATEVASAKHSAASEHQDAVNRVNLMKGSYDQLLREGQEDEARCLSTLKKLVAIYRRENVGARSEATIPAAFKVEPAFELELTKMKEKLDNEGSDLAHS